MRRNVNVAPAWAARRVGDVETHRQPPPAGARRKREEERGGPGPGDRAGEKGGRERGWFVRGIKIRPGRTFSFRDNRDNETDETALYLRPRSLSLLVVSRLQNRLLLRYRRRNADSLHEPTLY